MLALVTSFMTIGIVWINHHRVFTHIHAISHGLLLLNGLLLMTVSLIPFTTDLVAAYIAFAVFFALPAFTVSDARRLEREATSSAG